nr:hypothetical protein [Myxococcota bacterium]
VSVPIAYVPTWFASAAALLTSSHDGADRWSYPQALEDRDRVVRILLEHVEQHPHQHVVLASGDIHVGTAFELAWDHGPVFHQFTASALTNQLDPLAATIYRLVPHTQRSLGCDDRTAHVSPIAAAPGEPDANPYGGLNLGIVEVDDDGVRARVRFELITATAAGDPETVYRSPWLGGAAGAG